MPPKEEAALCWRLSMCQNTALCTVKAHSSKKNEKNKKIKWDLKFEMIGVGTSIEDGRRWLVWVVVVVVMEGGGHC